MSYDENDHDDDIPFHLPKANDDVGNIHKDDTEDIDVISTEELRRQDLPLAEGGDDEYSETVRHDHDVPFDLPHSDDVTSEHDSPIGNKFVTMPGRHVAQTLPGSGGMDPNPDFAAAQTTVPGQERYQRPPQPRRTVPPVPVAAQPPIHQKPLPRRRRKRRFNFGCMAVFIGLLLTFCGGLTLITTVGGVYAYARVGELLNETVSAVDDYTAFQSTFMYDRNGKLLYEIFGEGRRTNVHLDDMPQSLLQATIAIEDDSFYENIGIDVAATTVAFLQFVGAEPDESTPGGSTITQQLVRNVLFDPEYRAERSVQRKAEEILLAIALNGRKSKEEILELYLNEIYYGNLAYGAQAAAQVFFGKDVNELSLGEAALLAGLPQAPAELNPLNPDPEIQAAVDRRWRQVLNEMLEEGYITETERNQALRSGLTFSSPDVPLRAPHFTVYAQGQLEALMLDLGYSPDEITRGGLHVYTTVDLDIDNMARQAAAQQVAQLQANNISNAAVFVAKPITGEILAMVGSIDYNNDAIDGRVNVTTAFRQPGSTMKPFTYSAALERGLTPGDVIWDTRVQIGIPGQEPYIPRNYDETFHGPMAMRYALANSYNIPAVQTLRQVGVDYLLALMQRFGVETLGTDASRYGLSLTLGGGEITLLELTRAYGVFANQGLYVETEAIRCILDNDDNIIYQYENGCPHGNVTPQTVARSALGEQVLDPRIAFLISDMLADNRARTPAMGSQSALYTPSILTSVKTGTTNDVKDNWTVGFTRNVAVGVWVGNNNGDPMVNTSGLTGAAPIWNNVVSRIYDNQDFLEEFAVDGRLLQDQRDAPAGISRQQICDVRALRDPATNCPANITEWFLDSPAGLPDGSGSLFYPQAQQRQQEQVPASGSFVQEYSPGVYRTTVRQIDPAVANAIQFTTPPGERRPPPPLYCRVPVELIASTPGVREQLFIAPPPFPEDAAEAEEYARQQQYPFLPTIDCTGELLASGGGNYAASVTAIVTSPQPGDVVSPPVAIMGTADFSAYPNGYYKIDIIGGQFGSWTTIGPVRSNSVVNGQLDILPALPSGSYRMRLVIDNLNGQSAPPYEVPFTVP